MDDDISWKPSQPFEPCAHLKKKPQNEEANSGHDEIMAQHFDHHAARRGEIVPHLFRLFSKLQENAVQAFRMDEDDKTSSGACLRSFRYKLETGFFQLFCGVLDIVHIESDMVDALSARLQEPGHR